MIKRKGHISMGTAALVSGLLLFVPAAPYGEFYVFGKLIVSNDAARTTQNLLDHPNLFLSGIFAMLFTFIMDVVLAWTMYIFLKPVNAWLALLGAWLRLVYAALAIAALFNMVYAYQLINMPDFGSSFTKEHVLELVNARRLGMHLAYIVFGSYLMLGGMLIYKASYIPKIMGLLIFVAGLAWIINSLQPYFFKHYNLSWILIFGIGELVFGIWLLVRGRTVKEAEVAD